MNSELEKNRENRQYENNMNTQQTENEEIQGNIFIPSNAKLLEVHPNWLNTDITIDEVTWATSKVRN